MPLASDQAVEGALLEVVGSRFRAGDHDSLTLKRVRAAAEVQLNLPKDYLKNHRTWKEQSKHLVTEEVVCAPLSR